MPEGHVIHRLADEIEARFARRVVAVSSPQGRFEASAARLDGRKLLGAEAVGKHLFIRFGGAQWVHVHLGLYGRFTFGEAPVPEVVGQVRLRLVSRTSWADLRGAARCALIDVDERAAIEARLGDDPLIPESTGERAWARVSRSRAPLATLLMDQAIVAGIGNIYRAEVLFRAGLEPMRVGRSISRAQWDVLWADLVDLMRQGYEKGRIDTVDAAHEPEAMGRPPRVDDHGGEVYVYRRTGQPCHVCETPIRAVEHAGRNLFWCPTCQAP
jgi:endonuclease-8